MGRNIEEKHTTNNPLRYKDTIEILDSRQATTEDITAESVKAHASEQDERTAAEQLDKAETAYVRTVSSTNVPIHGKIRIDVATLQQERRGKVPHQTWVQRNGTERRRTNEQARTSRRR